MDRDRAVVRASNIAQQCRAGHTFTHLSFARTAFRAKEMNYPLGPMRLIDCWLFVDEREA
jgi:hypothetical protein